MGGMSGGNGCLLCGSEGVRGGIVFALISAAFLQVCQLLLHFGLVV